MEYLDYYNYEGVHLGIETRAEVHAKGLWHKTFHCFIIYKNDDGEDMIVMQKRGVHKTASPHMLDASVAGHISAGENLIGGLREFEEETGLTVSEDELTPLGTRVFVIEDHPNRINKEFQQVYFLNKRIALEDYRLPVDEVAGMLELPIDKCIDILTDKIDTFQAKGVFTDEQNGTNKLTIQEVTVQRKDFKTFIDDFYLKIMFLAKRALRNESDLFV